MSKINDLKEFTIKIEYNERYGSGCIYNAPNSDYTYIFTAKHCFADVQNIINDEIVIESIKKEDINGDNIHISRHISRSKWDCDFKVKDIFLAEDDIDVAIIVISKKDISADLKLMKVKANGKYDVSIYGYPEKLFDNKKYPTQHIGGYMVEVDNINGEFQFNIEECLDTFNCEAKTAIDAFSGCGVFREVVNQIYLVGIYNEVKVIDVAYNTLIGQDVSNFEKIINENNLAKLDIIYQEEHVSNIDKFISLNKWEKASLCDLSKWVDINSSRQIIETVKEHFNSDNNENILYIIGDSGIGKTRAVLEACKSNEIYKDVKYFEKYKTVDNKFLEELKISQSKSYIVIDDVTLEEWEEVNKYWEKNCNMRMVLIGVLPKNKRTISSGICYKDSPDKKEVKQILENNCELGEELINQIINLSDNDLRLALLIKDTFIKGNDISLLSSNDFNNRYTDLKSIYNRIIEQYKDEFDDVREFKKIYSKLCIFIEIGLKGNSKNELEVLKEHFNIDSYDMSKVINEAEKFSLGKIKYEYFETSPRVLSRYIFENVSWPAIKDELKPFMDNITDMMRKRFLNRVEECSPEIRKEVLEALASWFCGIFSIFDLSLINDDSKAKIFSVYTEFLPDLGLSWILNSLEQAIKNNSDLSHLYFRARRYIVWLVEHLSAFEEHYYLCEKILFILAQNETELHLGNNSKATWGGLFYITFSNTEVPFNKRCELFLKRIDDVSLKDFDIITQVITDNLSQWAKWSIVPPKVIGGRIVPKAWNPKNYEEEELLKHKFLSDIFKKAEELETNKTDLLIDYFISNIVSFINFDFLVEIVEFLISFIEFDSEKLSLLRSNLQNYIYTLKMTDKDKEKPNDSIILIESILEKIKPQTINEEFLTFLNTDYYRLGDENRRNEIVSDFSVKIIQNELSLEKYNEYFIYKCANNTILSFLMQKLGENDVNDNYYCYIEKLLKSNLLNNIVANYMYGYKIRKKILPEKFIKLLEEYKYKYSDYILSITVYVDLSDSGFYRTLEIIKNGTKNSSILGNFRYIEWNTFLDESKKLVLLKTIRHYVSKQEANRLILFLNYMWQNKTISNERIKLVISVLYDISEKYDMDLWIWEENIKIIPNNYIKEKIEILINTFERNHDLTLHEYIIKIIRYLGKDYSNIIVPEIGKVFMNTKNFYILNEVYKGLFDDFNICDVKKWVIKEGEDAAIVVARHLKSPEPNEENNIYVPELTEWILYTYENSDKVFQEFIKGRYLFQAYSVDEKIAEHDNLVKKMHPYLNHRLRRIKEWAKYEIKHSETIIEDHKNNEIINEREC
jgi:hypothetical protein